MSGRQAVAATGHLKEIVFEYTEAVHTLYDNGALRVKDPEQWWLERRRLDKWILERLECGYVAKTAKQLANSSNSNHDRGRHRVPGRQK